MSKKVTPTYDISWYIKWISTGFLLAGGFMAALAITPMNFLVASVGMFGWMVVGLMWHDRSIIVLNCISFTLAVLSYLNN